MRFRKTSHIRPFATPADHYWLLCEIPS